MPLPPWRPLLKAAQQRDGRSPAARWLQLATVSRDGTPRVRTLVFRGWRSDDQLLLFTDARSEKAGDFSHQSCVEVCWLFAKAKQQFRFRGAISITNPVEDPQLCQHYWATMRDSGRALWAWPDPGAELDPDASFPSELSEQSTPPDHFLVLTLQVSAVDHLDLTHHPHRRRRWLVADQWRERRLNP